MSTSYKTINKVNVSVNNSKTKYKVKKAPQNKNYNIRTCGEQGVAGAQGKSAYQIAVDEGFTGTKQEWLDSLKADVDDLTTDKDFLAIYLLAKG